MDQSNTDMPDSLIYDDENTLVGNNAQRYNRISANNDEMRVNLTSHERLLHNSPFGLRNEVPPSPKLNNFKIEESSQE